MNWKEFKLQDGDGTAYTYPEAPYTERMAEYKTSGSMTDLYFAEGMPGQQGLDPWEWGPTPDEIEWAGIDAELLALTLNTYTGENFWEDVVIDWPTYDEPATFAADPSRSSDVIMLTDGWRVVWERREWLPRGG